MIPIRVREHKNGSANASNSFVGISIWKGAPNFAAVLAQERYEWMFKWKLALAMLPLALVVGYFTHWAVSPVIFAFSMLISRIPSLLRRMELRGHAIEVAVAHKFYGVPLEVHEQSEARAMFYGYGGLFKSMGSDTVAGELKKLRGWANEWVDEHADVIRQDMKR